MVVSREWQLTEDSSDDHRSCRIFRSGCEQLQTHFEERFMIRGYARAEQESKSEEPGTSEARNTNWAKVINGSNQQMDAHRRSLPSSACEGGPDISMQSLK
jgi:hypothetical protein